MSAHPTISVVIPCYNAAEFVGAAVRSALTDAVDAEVIVVDDGSKDDTPARARDLIEANAGQVFVVSQANRGPAAARNLGLRMARGKSVCFLDADDEYSPGFLGEAAGMLERDARAVGVCCGVELVQSHRTVARWQLQLIEGTLPGNLVVRTDVVRMIGGFPEDPAFCGKASGEDGVFRRQLARFGSLSKIDRPLYRHRVRPGSHFDLFLDRTTMEGGKVLFKERTQEEADGTLAAALARYEEQARQRILADVRKALAFALACGGEMIELRKASAGEPVREREAWALFCLAKHWPAHGDVVLVSAREKGLRDWVEAGCRTAGAGGFVVARAPGTPMGATRMLVIGEDVAEELARRCVEAWGASIPAHGLIAVQRGEGMEEFVGRVVTMPAWRVLLRLDQLLVLERTATAR